MTDLKPHGSPKLLRRIAAWLIQSPEAPFILDDLDELLERDLAAGLSPWRARSRYVRNMLGSAFSVWRARLRRARPQNALSGAVSWLDFKLSLRMLIKYPGLTFVGGFGIAVAVAIGAASYEIISSVLDPALPVEDGERVVALINATDNPGNPDRRVLHDFAVWREELESVEQVGAYRTVDRNLVLSDGQAEPVSVAEMSASGFGVTRTPPLLGRHLVPDDEREGAPWVVVIGHDVWHARFASERGIVGQTIRLGATPHTVVGVMPEGFEFPVDHQFWVPLRVDPSDYERGEGPGLNVFGRLAPGVTLEDAQAELTTIGQRLVAAYPDTHEQLRPRVVRYTHELAGVESPMMAWILRLAQLLISMLLVVVCVNVAILVYARTVVRGGEIAVRSALGASRRRIVAQLFVEALALSTLGAVIGLVPAQVTLRRLEPWLASVGSVPYWFDLDLSVGTALYVLALAVLAAVIVGVLPALKATGRRMQNSLRELSGGTRARLGRTWTVLIVAQVSIAVAVLSPTVMVAWGLTRSAVSGPGFPADEFLTARVVLNQEAPARRGAENDEEALRSRLRARQTEMVDRLEAEPGISAVALSSGLPGLESMLGRIELDGAPVQETETSRRVRYLRVGLGVFDAYDAEILAGRAFDAGDLGGEAIPAIVNRTFAQEFFRNRNVLGRRIRYVPTRWLQPELWQQGKLYEIVGVVNDFPAYPSAPGRSGEAGARVYHPLAPGELRAVRLSLRVERAAPDRKSVV